MGDAFSIVGISRDRLLEEARQFSEQVKVFDLTEAVNPTQPPAPGRAGFTFRLSDSKAVTSALRLAPKLAMALVAMHLDLCRLEEELAGLKAQAMPRPPAPSTAAEISSTDGKPLADEMVRLRRVIENLVLNAEFAWEQGAEARDWREAIAEARAILHSDESK